MLFTAAVSLVKSYVVNGLILGESAMCSGSETDRRHRQKTQTEDTDRRHRQKN